MKEATMAPMLRMSSPLAYVDPPANEPSDGILQVPQKK